MIVAVTGGIGSGKSTVCKKLAEILSAPIVSADSVCRTLLRINGEGWFAMKSLFGSEFFLPDGQLNRPLLRKQLFKNDDLRNQLDSILHPLVRQEMLAAGTVARKKKMILLAEVPLLFEKGWQSDFDLTILVYTDMEQCVERIVKRDLVTDKEAREAIAVQMPLDEKVELADVVIDNNKSKTAFKAQLFKITKFVVKKNSF